jgi:hypothetical protein
LDFELKRGKDFEKIFDDSLAVEKAAKTIGQGSVYALDIEPELG